MYSFFNDKMMMNFLGLLYLYMKVK